MNRRRIAQDYKMQSFVIFIYTYCGVLLELSVLNIDSGFFEEKKQTAFVGGRDLCMEEISGQQADHPVY